MLHLTHSKFNFTFLFELTFELVGKGTQPHKTGL